jgi:hypothetical protein
LPVTNAAVERALQRTYNVPDKALPAFRGRLGALQKQELFGRRNMPGKGVALRYGPDQFHRLVFACELFEFGIYPRVVLDLVEARWDRRIAAIFRQAENAAMRDPSDDDIVLHMGGVHLMIDALMDTVPNVNSYLLRKLPDHMHMWMTMGPDDPAGLPPRALVVNLSARLRAFHRWLAASDKLRTERGGRLAKARKAGSLGAQGIRRSGQGGEARCTF